MSGNTLSKLCFIGLLVLMASCKTKKAIVKAPAANATVVNNQKAENIKLLKGQDLVFSTLALKAKANLEMNGSTNNVTMNIRIAKDEKIWVSITAIAGFEVARALITPDSIKVRNNLQSTYVKQPFNYVHRYAGKQVNFNLLQSILSGNTVGDFLTEDAELKQENGVWLLSGQKGDLVYRVLFNTLLKVNEDNLSDVKSGQALKVVYGEYQKVDDTLIPSTVNISAMVGTRRVGLNLDFSKIERNVPLEFPFNVPKKYEVIN